MPRQAREKGYEETQKQTVFAEIPGPGYWEEQFKDQSTRPKGTYDQGGYWGTGLDHFLQTVADHHSKDVACKMLSDAISNFQSITPIQDSFLEWQYGPKFAANHTPCKQAGNPCAATGYVATAAAAYRASTLLECWR